MLNEQREQIIRHLETLGVLPIVENDNRQTNGGSSNYAQKVIQPWAIWIEYQLNPWDADILKRLLRTKDDPSMTPALQRILDYEKIQHICQERIDQIHNGDPYYRSR